MIRVMLFTNFLLTRVTQLEKATHGYGSCISERSLYATLAARGISGTDFLVLLRWGILTGLLVQKDTGTGRQFIVDRHAIAALRIRANGESPANPAVGGVTAPPANRS